MSAEVYDEMAYEVSADQAKAELQRLLSDPRFRVSDRQRDILKYLAQRQMAGHRDSVKAYAIALDVLGRANTFDASLDPIVRIEVSRLRTALSSYYSVFGRELGISIVVPKGSYIAQFAAQPPAAQVEVAEAAAVKSQRRRFAPAALLVLALAGSTGAFWSAANRPVMTEKPSVIISMSSQDPKLAGEASQTRDMLLTALTGFQTVVVSRAGAAPRENARTYEIELKYYDEGSERGVWWQAVDAASGELLKSGMERVEVEGLAPAAIRARLAGQLAREIAYRQSAINLNEVQQALPDALGNACVLRAEQALAGGLASEVASATRCIDRTLAENADDADNLALSARTGLYSSSAGSNLAAMEAARRAIMLAPLSDRAQAAMMAAQFAAGETHAAVETGTRAMALNPENPDNLAALSFVLFSGGHWQAASDLARKAASMADGPAPEAILVLALEAYRTGRWSEASLLAERAGSGSVLLRALRVAALGQMEADDAPSRLQAAQADIPDFESSVRNVLATAGLPPALVEGLEVGLTKAGAGFGRLASIKP
ncbi:hypothetical protein FPY71_15235 [Aureimonas fodinaquatilis]|uniref:Uncharacterized protein n=1 Tax=Aureimonas fodinaquatilis TaxID=2565783 RepID=A0A5B0DQ01_9HYPH|nr:hypothetical protein [Aureimonas fodinaquatilis]KAA0968917.1 hypothetical protein FPY71_15235 [Aureimonas fodinaquatilis]